jgi:asparagine synthase (glutamine-hydrolysing)
VFVLTTGAAARDRDDSGAWRGWRDDEGRGEAASLPPHDVPEDVHDAQPIVTEDLVFVCRARIERADLAARLGISADSASVMADSALLLAAYRRWGADCPLHVDGDFAYAAWHFREGRAEAAVDHMGAAAPLFWARLGDGLAIADNLRALLDRTQVSRDLDLAALAGSLQVGVSRSSTPWLAVRAITGGRRLSWRRGGEPRIERWWRPATEPVWRRDPRDYSAEAKALFEEAVATRLRTRRGVASTLSGGLDSGLVTAVAARQLAAAGRTLTAYTAAPEPGLPLHERDGWDADDTPFARLTATAQPALSHVLVTPEGRSLIEVLPKLFANAWLPPRGGANLLWFDGIASAAAAAGAGVLLTGQQGNATLTWSGGGAVIELLRHRRWREGVRLTADSAAFRGRSVLTEWLAVLAPYLRRPPAAEDRPAAGFLRAGRRLSVEERSPELRLRRGTRRSWVGFVTTPPHAWQVDPVAQWGLSLRDPTADRKLMEALLTFPLAAFHPDGWPRGLARQVAIGLLPDPVRLRRARGQQAPERAALVRRAAADYRAAIAEVAASASAAELLDTARLSAALDRLAAGSDDADLAAAFLEALSVGLFVARADCSG